MRENALDRYRRVQDEKRIAESLFHRSARERARQEVAAQADAQPKVAEQPSTKESVVSPTASVSAPNFVERSSNMSEFLDAFQRQRAQEAAAAQAAVQRKAEEKAAAEAAIKKAQSLVDNGTVSGVLQDINQTLWKGIGKVEDSKLTYSVDKGDIYYEHYRLPDNIFGSLGENSGPGRIVSEKRHIAGEVSVSINPNRNEPGKLGIMINGKNHNIDTTLGPTHVQQELARLCAEANIEKLPEQLNEELDSKTELPTSYRRISAQEYTRRMKPQVPKKRRFWQR